MKIERTPIPGLIVAESIPYADERGEFMRCFCGHELKEYFGERQVCQINQSITLKEGAIRGLHFQSPPHAEMKLVRCIEGAVWDVAVDLRLDSPTRYSWHAEFLTSENRKMFIIPEGFAHGFQVLRGHSRLIYLHTEYYCKTSEGGIRFDDPYLGIPWPRPVTEVSSKDLNLPYLEV